MRGCAECHGLCSHKRTYRRLFIGGPYSGQVHEVQDGTAIFAPKSGAISAVEDQVVLPDSYAYYPKDLAVFGARFRVYLLAGLYGEAVEQELLRYCLASVLLESRVG